MKPRYLIAVMTLLPVVGLAELPKESADIVDKLKSWELEKQVELQREMKAKRAQVVEVLQRHWEEAAKDGNATAALAIEAEIARLIPAAEERPKLGSDMRDKPVKPPREAHRGKHSYYLWIDKEVSWTEAQAQCERLGGNLVCIESDEEWQEIMQFRDDQGYRGRRFWIGFSAPAGKNDYQWVNGSEKDFENWGASPQSKPETTGVAAGMNGSWLAYPKDQTQGVVGFICEWPK